MITTDDMVRQTNVMMQQPHQDELPDELSARQALESALGYLERVKTAKDAGGNFRHSWEDRTAAQNDFKQKFDAYNKASNAAARERRLAAEQAEQQARNDARAATQALGSSAGGAVLNSGYSMPSTVSNDNRSNSVEFSGPITFALNFRDLPLNQAQASQVTKMIEKEIDRFVGRLK